METKTLEATPVTSDWVSDKAISWQKHIFTDPEITLGHGHLAMLCGV